MFIGGHALGRFSYAVRSRRSGSANYERKAKTNVGVRWVRGGVGAMLGKEEIRAGTGRRGWCLG